MKRAFEFLHGLGFKLQVAVSCGLVVILLAAGGAIALFSGSSVQEATAGYDRPIVLVPVEPSPSPSPSPAPVPTPASDAVLPDVDEPEEEVFVDERPISMLTGLHAYEEELARRPIAVVINNQFGAHPHSGIAYADIIYQVLVEGTTTRLVAVFQSSVPEKIGPVRSVRDYFVDFAFNHDAFFVHHGGSPTGNERVRNLLGVNAVDGMRFESTVFWRDRSFPEWTELEGQRALEHSSYVGFSTLRGHIESRNIRGYFNGAEDNPRYGFAFGTVPHGVNSVLQNITRVTVPFSNTNQTTFTFCNDTGLYFVEHTRGPWMDEYSVTQVSVANILIQHTAIRLADGEGRRSVDTVGRGTGYLMRDGLVFNVIWEKSSHTSPMRWYFEDGRPIVLAPGRTWINVLQTSAFPEFGLKEQSDE